MKDNHPNDQWWNCPLCKRRFSGRLYNEKEFCTDCVHRMKAQQDLTRDSIALRIVGMVFSGLQ